MVESECEGVETEADMIFQFRRGEREVRVREKTVLYQSIQGQDREERECYVDSGNIQRRKHRGNLVKL